MNNLSRITLRTFQLTCVYNMSKVSITYISTNATKKKKRIA